MLQSLRQDVIKCIDVYRKAIHTAPKKRGYVLGQQCESLNDARYKFIDKLKNLGELCVLVGDAETLAIIKMQANTAEAQAEKDLSDISNLKIE